MVVAMRVAVIVAVTVMVLVRMVRTVIVVVAALMLSAKVVVAIAAVQNLHLNQVKNEAHHGYNQHNIAFDLRWHEESLGCLNKKPDCHDPNRTD